MPHTSYQSSNFYFFYFFKAKPLAPKHSLLYIILEKTIHNLPLHIWHSWIQIPKFPKNLNKKKNLTYAYSREAMRVETPLPWKDANNSKWQPLNVAAFFYAKMTAGSIGFPIESASQWQSGQSVHEDGEILSMVCRFYNSDGAMLG